MRIIKTIFIVVLIYISAISLHAQGDCTLNLQAAEKFYVEGKIEKVPNLIQGCIQSGFNTEERVTALRLLTLVYLFDDNVNMAEETLLKMLKIDPEYVINHAVDPVEFIKLYNSYNTDPRFSIGVVAGLNFSLPRLIETFSLYNFNEANPEYKSNGAGFSFGLRGTYHLNKNIDLFFEPMFSNYNYALTENVSDANLVDVTEALNYIELPVYGSYFFYRKNQFNFFGELGASYGMLLSGKFNGSRTFPNQEFPDVTGSAIESKDIRRNYLISGIVGAGAKMNMKQGNLQFSMRYKMGVNNIMNIDERYTDYENITTDYFFIDNNFSLNNFSIMLSYHREFYIHKKKTINKHE